MKALSTRTPVVVSVMWANNEVGTLQPVREIAAFAAQQGAISHSDAVQAVGHSEVDFAASGLDMLTFTAHKLGGPYGIGALLARRELQLAPIMHGGGQERDVRSGTLDVAATAGFAAALEVATRNRVAEEQRLRQLRRELIGSVLAAVPWAVPYGSADEAGRLPGIASIGFPGCSADAILMLLDSAGIDCSTRSGLFGGSLTAEPCPACHGLQRGRGALGTQILAGPHLDPGRRTGAR